MSSSKYQPLGQSTLDKDEKCGQQISGRAERRWSSYIMATVLLGSLAFNAYFLLSPSSVSVLGVSSSKTLYGIPALIFAFKTFNC